MLRLWFLLSAAHFQITAQPVSTETRWSRRSVPLPMNGNDLHIVVPAFPPGSRWILGVKSVAESGATVSEDMIVSTPVSSRLRPAPDPVLMGFQPVPMESMGIGTSLLTLPGGIQRGSALLVYITLPSGTTVTVDGPQGTLMSMLVKDSLILESGTVIPVQLSGPEQLAIMLNLRSSTSAVSDIPPTISIATLRASLLNYVDLGALRTPALAPGFYALAKIVIDEQGHVVSIAGLPESAPESLKNAISQWQFRPSQTTISAKVPILLGADRQSLTSPLSPAATLQ